MKNFYFTFILLASVAIGLSAPTSESAPFEPGFASCFNWEDKFSHPAEVVPAKIVYPEEMIRVGIIGEVVALVVLKLDGTLERIAILYDTHADSKDSPGSYFADAVCEGLKKARWSSQNKLGVWFYVKKRFLLVEDGDKIPSGSEVVVGILPPANSIMR